jgi:carboxypeptidase family protein/TonB-dependent receptor-like protein
MPKIWLLLICLLGSGRGDARTADGGAFEGTVSDASGAPVPSAEIALLSPVTGFSLRARTQSDGMFFLNDVAAGSYSLRVSAAGFQPYVADVVLQGAAVCELKIRLDVAGQHTSITIESSPDHILETDASAVNRVERKVIEALPAASPDSGLNDAITFTTAGVAADSNGFFHPLGDHAQVSYVIDGQPVSDQRNKVFSTSIPANAIQSMEVISGSQSTGRSARSARRRRLRLVRRGGERSWLSIPRGAGGFLTHLNFGPCMMLVTRELYSTDWISSRMRRMFFT